MNMRVGTFFSIGVALIAAAGCTGSSTTPSGSASIVAQAGVAARTGCDDSLHRSASDADGEQRRRHGHERADLHLRSVDRFSLQHEGADEVGCCSRNRTDQREARSARRFVRLLLARQRRLRAALMVRGDPRTNSASVRRS